MKKNALMIFGMMMLAVVLVARADGQLDAAKTAPAEKPAKKAKASAAKTAAPATIAEKPVVLMPGAATITGKNVNVRGKASFKGEVITKLQNGDNVTVLEQIILSKPKAGEPSNWAKIAFPASAHVWVHSSYVTAEKTVKPKKLNVRSGAGENYSVVGTLEQGAAVKEISTKENWTQIEAPASAFAFVAAMFIQQAPGAPDAVPTIVSIQPPEPTTTSIGSEPLIATNPTDVGNTNASAEPTPTVVQDVNNATPPPAVIEEVLVPRTVSHEGIVRRSVSIQAPTEYALYAKENNKLINYLYTPTAVLDISRYYGRHIIVSGQEGLDERWINTPVLTIQKIYVVTE
jgi:SH3-like domain-containing protein